MQGVVGLAQLAQHVAGDSIHVGLVVGVVDLAIDFCRFAARGGKSRMLGHRIVALNHAICVEQVSNLTESRNIDNAGLRLAVLEFAGLGGKGSGALRNIACEFVEMPLVVESQKGTVFVGFSEFHHTGICGLEWSKSRFKGCLELRRRFYIPDNGGWEIHCLQGRIGG